MLANSSLNGECAHLITYGCYGGSELAMEGQLLTFFCGTDRRFGRRSTVIEQEVVPGHNSQLQTAARLLSQPNSPHPRPQGERTGPPWFQGDPPRFYFIYQPEKYPCVAPPRLYLGYASIHTDAARASGHEDDEHSSALPPPSRDDGLGSLSAWINNLFVTIV